MAMQSRFVCLTGHMNRSRRYNDSFDLAGMQTSLETMIDAAAKMPPLLPDDSKTAAKPRRCRRFGATRRIWTRATLSSARMPQPRWRRTIKDQASFATAMPAIFKYCGGCQEKYRASEN